MDHRTHILEYIPPKKSEMSYSRKYRFKQIRDPITLDTHDQRAQIPCTLVYTPMNRDTHKQLWVVYEPYILRHTKSAEHRFPLPSNSEISKLGHRLSNTLETSFQGLSGPNSWHLVFWMQTRVNLGDVSSWDLEIHIPQRIHRNNTQSSKEFMDVKPGTLTAKHLSDLIPRTDCQRAQIIQILDLITFWIWIEKKKKAQNPHALEHRSPNNSEI